MPADLKNMYEGILAATGGADNIATLGCCMTRLRFTVKDEALVHPNALRKVPDVAGYFYSGVQHQLIFRNATTLRRFPIPFIKPRPNKRPLLRWGKCGKIKPLCANAIPVG